MLTIRNIEQIKLTDCGGKVCQKVGETPAGRFYKFYFNVEDFSDTLQKKFKLFGYTDVVVLLDKIKMDDEYYFCDSKITSKTEVKVTRHLLETPIRAAVCIGKCLEKIEEYYANN